LCIEQVEQLGNLSFHFRAGRSGTCYCLLTPEELPYMFDIGTHIGRKLVNEEAGKELMNTEVGCYGSIPKNLLATEYEEIEEYHKRSEELEKLLKSLKNGYTKYLKMRTPASKLGTLKMKEALGHIKDHPLLVKDEDNEQNTLLEGIKNYKPRKGKKMAFMNPYSDTMQKLAEHSSTHRVILEDTKQESIEEEKQEPESDKKCDEDVDDSVSDEENIKEVIKEQKLSGKRAHPEAHRDTENYITFEPTTSKEKLHKVNNLVKNSYGEMKSHLI
jgi:hypothetical protein